MLGIYEHYKGNQYEVIGRAVDEKTLTPLVLYRAWPQRIDDFTIWSRTADDFFGFVEVEMGTTVDDPYSKMVPRFRFLHPAVNTPPTRFTTLRGEDVDTISSITDSDDIQPIVP